MTIVPHKIFVFVALLAGLTALLACSEKPRPSETEIRQDDYKSACVVGNFAACKGKFVRFDGIVGGNYSGQKYLRIRNEAHGFDVFGLVKIDGALAGSKVVFSGYLKESHFFNDDVVDGRIEAVLKNAAEVRAEKILAEAAKNDFEQEHPTCATNWKACGDNSDLVANSPVWTRTQIACRRAANESARYGAPKWGWAVFSKFLRGDDYPRTGRFTAVDEDVRFQNGFGVYGRTRVVCVF